LYEKIESQPIICNRVPIVAALHKIFLQSE